MGLGCTTLRELENNDNLLRFCGREVITPNDYLWNKLVSHSLPPVFSREDSFMLDACVESLKNELLKNNLETGNFSALVRVFTMRAKELQSSVQTSDSMFIWQAYNALFIVRNVIKYFAEFSSEEVFNRHFASEQPRTPQNVKNNGQAENSVETNGATSVSAEQKDNLMESLIETLLQIIVELPVKNFTYLLHLEAINTLIILLSTQMFSNRNAMHLQPYRIIMDNEDTQQAALVVKTLLRNYIHHRVPPYSVWQGRNSGSIVIEVASGIWNIFRKGVGLEKPKDPLDALKEHNLASHSLYLLLVLINHCTARGENSPVNLYREALVSFMNDTEDVLGEPMAPFKLSYSSLYESICQEIKTDDTTLLLYMLIHRNSAFRSYVMARSDIEQLVLPILHTLYNAPTSASHHIYMSLIVLLVLSEDELFNQQVHDISLRNITWYTERNVSEISLGGLIILVVIRTIHYNILKMRDKYLHTNCLAALANMSSKFRSLHPYVAQRLVSVFETLAKRHSKLLDKFNKESDSQQASKQESEKASEIVQDINVLEEVIRMVLEILNSVLSHQLPQNRHLVYTLLYKKAVFDTFRNYDATQDLVSNIDIVINYFNKRLGSEHTDLSSSEVMRIVEDGVLHWSQDMLKKFPDLKFRYVEEDQPEEFFIPYVWSLIYHNSGIHWSSLNVTLFNTETEFLLTTD